MHGWMLGDVCVVGGGDGVEDGIGSVVNQENDSANANYDYETC